MTKTTYPEFDAPASRPPISLPHCVGYHVLVEPREPPSTSVGGIVLPQKTKRANRATDYIGTLLAVGQFAWQAKTPELDWNALERKPQVGELVVFKQMAGQKMRLRQQQAEMIAGDLEDEHYLLLMADTDIIGILTPEQAEQFYSWV